MCIRVQQKRIKGWKKPDNTVSVTRPGMFGNPFKAGTAGIHSAGEAIAAYKQWIETTDEGRQIAVAARQQLKDRNLMCYCKIGDPCHADVLLKIANE